MHFIGAINVLGLSTLVTDDHELSNAAGFKLQILSIACICFVCNLSILALDKVVKLHSGSIRFPYPSDPRNLPSLLALLEHEYPFGLGSDSEGHTELCR